jgi:hypothetical protein
VRKNKYETLKFKADASSIPDIEREAENATDTAHSVDQNCN